MSAGGGNPWGAVVAGAGQAVMSLNDYLASEKRDKIMKYILERRGRQQDDMDAIVNAEITQQRGETPEAERAQAMNEFTQQLKAAQATKVAPMATGAVSARHAGAVQGLEGELGEFAGREADITARLDSQRRMREGQGLRLGRVGTDMRHQNRKIESADFLDELRLARARKNPWLDVLGSAMKGAGGAMAGGTGGGGSFDADAFQKSSSEFMKTNFSR